METFIVRFYRHEGCSLQEIAGVVEHADSGERSGFSGQQQLLDRLLKHRHAEPRISAASAVDAAAQRSEDPQ